MSNHAEVSVVIPCFNAAEFIGKAVARLLEQEFIRLEIVLVDDASTDTTAPIIAELSARHPEVISVLLPENGGVAAAREAGVMAASADYVWFVDADDTWPSNAASLLVDTARSTGAEIVCAGARVLAAGREPRDVAVLPDRDVISGAEALRALLNGRITGHLWNKLFRRVVLERITFTPIRQHSDQAMVAQALVEADRVAILRAHVYDYQLRAGSIIRSGSRRSDSLRELGRVVARCVARVDATALRQLDYLYYRARFNQLSRLKDATSGSYTDVERRALVRQVRSEMSPRELTALVKKKDAVRFALYSIGYVSPRAYSAVLDRAGGRL